MQEEIEKQQEHVNSLQSMVVVVDDSNSDEGMHALIYLVIWLFKVVIAFEYKVHEMMDRFSDFI